MEKIMNKTCSTCLITKDVSEFYISNSKPIAACKDCIKKASKNYAIKTGKIKGNYGRSRFEKLIGHTINDWTVIGNALVKGKASKVLCKCKCGKEQLVICARLENKKSKGCRSCHPVNGANSHLFKGVGEISISYLKNIVDGAKSRNLTMNVNGQQLWELYLTQNKKCALTGLDLDFGKHTHGYKTKLQSQTASLDRINSSLGYNIENLQWVHKHINMMKNKYDNDYFKQMCKLVTENDN